MRALGWACERMTTALARLCPHPRHLVVDDLAEGDLGRRAIRWCRRCGSINRTSGILTGWEWPMDPWRCGPKGVAPMLERRPCRAREIVERGERP